MTTAKPAASPFRRRQRRVLFLWLILPAFAGATALSLAAISQTQVYFYAPSALLDAPLEEVSTRDVRVGGLVEIGTLRQGEETRWAFSVTDCVASIPVLFDGELPSLITEDEDVVAVGRYSAEGVFKADSILAKHDENYMAPEVADTLNAESGEGYAYGGKCTGGETTTA